MTVVYKLVGYTKIEDAFCRSQHFRLHAVFCHSTIEVVLENNVSLGYLSVTLPLVDSGTNKTILTNGIFQPLSIGGGHTANRHES